MNEYLGTITFKYKNAEELTNKMHEVFPGLKSEDPIEKMLAATDLFSDNWFATGMIQDAEHHVKYVTYPL